LRRMNELTRRAGVRACVRGDSEKAAEEKSKYGVFQLSYLRVLLRKARSFNLSRRRARRDSRIEWNRWCQDRGDRIVTPRPVPSGFRARWC
jgi:hypothetical protein